QQVSAADFIIIRCVIERGWRGSYGYFYISRRPFTSEEVRLPTHIIADGLCNRVACNSDGLISDNAGKGDQSDLCSTSSDIYNHRSHRLFDVDPDTDGSSQRFIDHIDFFGARMLG